MNIEERIEQLEFQLELLFENRGIDRLFFESKITRAQFLHIADLMDYVSAKICNGEEVSKDFFEDEILSIVPQKRGDYHFSELIAKCWYDEHQWPEVFEYFYGDLPKYSYLKNHN